MLKANAGVLAAALTRALPANERRNTIPILSCARLRTESGVLTASCSNLDQQIDVDATVVQTGPSAQIALGARRLHAILRQLPKLEPVELISEESRAVINWNGGRVVLPALPASGFPELEIGAGDVVEGPIGDEVREALARCAPFISTEETRYYLNGACLWEDKGRAYVVATDGRRLCAIPGGQSLDRIVRNLRNHKPVVPRDFVRVWLGLGPMDLTLQVRTDGLKLGLWGEGVRLRTKMIDGDFPNWTRALPDRRDLRKLTAPRVALLSACAIAQATQVKGDTNSLLVADGGRLQVMASSIEASGVAIDVGPAPGATLELGVNLRLLRQAIGSVRGSGITLWVSDHTGPMLVEGSDQRADEHVVLMPLRSATRPAFSAPALAEAA